MTVQEGLSRKTSYLIHIRWTYTLLLIAEMLFIILLLTSGFWAPALILLIYVIADQFFLGKKLHSLEKQIFVVKG